MRFIVQPCDKPCRTGSVDVHNAINPLAVPRRRGRSNAKVSPNKLHACRSTRMACSLSSTARWASKPSIDLGQIQRMAFWGHRATTIEGETSSRMTAASMRTADLLRIEVDPVW